MTVVVFEGINAAGKTGTIAHVRDVLTAAGRRCLAVDPAGFGRVGRVIRSRLVDPSMTSNADYDSVLFAALRTEGGLAIQEVLRAQPSTTVLLERWSLALAAFGAADGASATLVGELRRLLQRVIAVDLTLLLDVPGSIASERIGAAAIRNRFEAKGADYLERVREHYRQVGSACPNLVLVEAAGSRQQTFELVWEALRPFVEA